MALARATRITAVGAFPCGPTDSKTSSCREKLGVAALIYQAIGLERWRLDKLEHRPLLFANGHGARLSYHIIKSTRMQATEPSFWLHLKGYKFLQPEEAELASPLVELSNTNLQTTSLNLILYYLTYPGRKCLVNVEKGCRQSNHQPGR
ncbi:hypothetical protein BN1723_014775 [Verticillium longisporum]|uniref:Uncharacterized protein n=1 Tax=Verticillium longisporum TaxID=100787 RepID=A0A0G4MHX5_VERLO|nr:hypothetical protein BN1708_013739 [Verticillium longisporum]CRK33799.1 hypothetical protein BN1723_014775 [Verticillium longisporum]